MKACRIHISKTFRFSEYTGFDTPNDNESDWAPAHIASKPHLLRNKWVYVFQTKSKGAPEKGASTKLFRVCWVEENDVIHELDATEAQKSDASSIPWNLASKGPILSLPDRINNEQFYYFFFASRIPLVSKTISILEGNISKYLPAVNLPDQADWVGVDLVPVVDPITIAETLQAAFERSATAAIHFMMETADSTPAQIEAARTRAGLMILGKSLKGILEADKADKLKIRGDKPAILQNIEKFLSDDANKVDRLVQEREDTARALVRWLGSSLWRLTESSYREQATQVYDRYVTALAVVTDGLPLSDAGKDYFSKFKEKEPYAYEQYVVRHTEVPDEMAETVKKCFGASLSILKDLVPYLSKTEGNELSPDDLQKLLRGTVNRLARVELLLETKFGDASIPMRTRNGVHVAHATLQGLEKNIANSSPSYESWTRLGRKVEVLGLFLDVANVTINISKFPKEIKDHEFEAFMAGVKMVGSTASVYKAFAGILKVTKAAAKVAGVIAAVIEAVSAAVDIVKSGLDSNWPKAGVGVLVLAGTALSLISALELTMTFGARAGIIGFIGAAITLGGTLLVDYFTDTDFGTFVKHCSFGTNRSGLADKPDWSPTKMDTWTQDAGGLARQMAALYNICAAVELTAAAPAGVHFSFGDLYPTSHIYADFHVEYDNESTLDVRVRIEALSGMVTEKTREAAVKTIRDVDSGRHTLEVYVDWPNGLAPGPRNTSRAPIRPSLTSVAIWMDVFGDGSLMIPEKPLRALIYRFPAIIEDVFNTAHP